jgi:hypothetical protein
LDFGSCQLHPFIIAFIVFFVSHSLLYQSLVLFRYSSSMAPVKACSILALAGVSYAFALPQSSQSALPRAINLDAGTATNNEIDLTIGMNLVNATGTTAFTAGSVSLLLHGTIADQPPKGPRVTGQSPSSTPGPSLFLSSLTGRNGMFCPRP